MGSHAECWLESLYVGSTKNDFDHSLMQLFRASDKRVERSAAKDLPRSMMWADYVVDPNEKVDFVYYTAPARIIRDRLDLKGYTLAAAKRAFMKRIRRQAKDYSEPTVGMEDYYENRESILKALDVDKWLATLRHIRESGLGTSTHGMSPYKPVVNLEEFMLEEDSYGFSGVDLYVPLRLALEICNQDDNFIYNLTDLVSGGYVKKREDCVAIASEFSAGVHTSRSKIVVLTEGRSDEWILSESMKLLYPHLYDYFAFMDFETARVEGGASHLAKIVKSLAGAGIINKVIAIFDNDTIGQEAIHSLRQVKLPGNLSVLKLPDLKALRKYPTIGPSGPRKMNVNGSAASIELYLGDDVLRQNGKLPPVQWSAYNPGMGKYQGSLLDTEKDKVQKRFKEKLAQQKTNTNLAQDQNWAGLFAIMSSIFSAFHRFDQKIIAEERLEKYTRA